MTELERAKAHLRECQESLAHARRIGWPGRDVEQWGENNVLAALSWLWEEQCAAEEVWKFVGKTPKGMLTFGVSPRGRRVSA